MFPWEKKPCVQRFPKFIHWSMTAKVKLKRLPSARCGVTPWKFNSEFSLKSYHHPKRKGKDHLPTIIFQGRAVKLRGCKRKMISHFVWVCIYHFFLVVVSGGFHGKISLIEMMCVIMLFFSLWKFRSIHVLTQSKRGFMKFAKSQKTWLRCAG